MNSTLTNLYVDMVSLREHIKLLHFQTVLYPLHKTTDQFLVTYDGMFDKLWEVLQQGKFRVVLGKDGQQIVLHNVREISDLIPVLNKVKTGLGQVSHQFDAGVRTTVEALLEEINQFEYLLTFH